jgi:hypothetical protein
VLAFIHAQFFVEQDQALPDVSGRVSGITCRVEQVGAVAYLNRRSGKCYGQRTFTVTLPVSSWRSDP